MTAGHGTDDRMLLGAALLAAAALHVAAIWIPLPPAPAPAAVDPPEEPRPIGRRLPPPPPRVEPPERPRPPEPRRRPLAVPQTRDALEPIAEESPPMIEDAPDIDLPDVPYGAPAPPPRPAAPGPATVAEDHPGLELPLPIARPQPVYPRMGTISRTQATVRLEALVDATGQVVDVRVVEVEGGPDVGFSAAAVEAVSSWRYEPGRLDGRPVAVRLSVVVTFRLR